MEKYITREDVLLHAVKDCYREMFAKAQPEADWDNLIAEYKAGKIDEKKDGPVYDRHYLSTEEYMYIIDKYINAYKVKSEWKEDIDILKEYLLNGGSKDKYIEAYDDEYGHHPGYRGYEKVAPLKDQVSNIISEYFGKNVSEQLVDKIVDKVFNIINTCQDFYSFNIDEQKFRNTLAMGATPTSNKETVKKWWKEHYNVDIEIEDRIPKLFWYFDNGYTHQDLIEEFGENYDEILLKEWEDEKDLKRKENQALYEKLLKNLKEKEESKKE